MGCAPSKEAAAAVLKQPDVNVPVDGTSGNSSAKNEKAVKTTPLPTRPTDATFPASDSVSSNELPVLSDVVDQICCQQQVFDSGLPPRPPPKDAITRAESWKVRPGYSSGASSIIPSESSTDLVNDSRSDLKCLSDSEGSTTESGIGHRRDHSKLSDIVAALREDIAADNDLLENMVRIETPYDTPIGEVFDGVHDGEILGAGVSGLVRLVTHRTTGVQYAMKCLDVGLLESEEGLQQLREEIFIMCQLDHPNIVRIEEVYESQSEIFIVQELCTGGELFDRLEELSDYHYTEAQCAKLVKQMLSAVRYLHSKGIIHRDLKLENFIFSSNKADSELKLIDFGLSKHFKQGEHLHDIVGTPYTVAPWILQGNYDEKADLWSLGVITYLLLSGETPFGGLDGENPLDVRNNIMQARVTFEPREIWDVVSDSAKSFVLKLLNPDPSKIPTAKDMQKDRWIKVWAKKDAQSCNTLNSRTVRALLKFKESSDMQKLLSEVLSFTLLPEQIVDLRREFEKIDAEGDGEISVEALKRVLMESAESGSLRTIPEKEIEEMFDAMKLHKNSPTIRWHEFLAASLSQAAVDDRNLRLAFDRLDIERKGFLTFDDLSDILGCTRESNDLREIWLQSLQDCKSIDRIMYADFKRLMQVPIQQKDVMTPVNDRTIVCLSDAPAYLMLPEIQNLSDTPQYKGPYQRESRSRSHEVKSSFWQGDIEPRNSPEQPSPLTAVFSHDNFGSEAVLSSRSLINHAIYLKRREMRLAVLEASKRFDQKMNDIQTRAIHRHAGLTMRRGSTFEPRPNDIFPKRACLKNDGGSSDFPIPIPRPIAALVSGGSPRFHRRTRLKSRSDIRGMMQ